MKLFRSKVMEANNHQAQTLGNLKPRTTYTEDDFDSLSWETIQVRGVIVPFSKALASQMAGFVFNRGIVLDVDCAIELLPTGENRHAPGKLEFHGITDLNITFSSSDSGFQNAPSTFFIGDIKRELISDQKVHFDKLYYSWAIQLCNSPDATGQLTFGAYGFTLQVAEAVLSKPLHQFAP